MPDEKRSLPLGRNNAPLTDDEVRRVTNTFLGIDRHVPTKYVEGQPTGFCVALDEHGEPYGLVQFGSDIYPGSDIIDPNNALSMKGAVVHELTHFHRWTDKLALNEDELEHLDEALTSLHAVLRYGQDLDISDVRQLVADACQRVMLYVKLARDGAEDTDDNGDD